MTRVNRVVERWNLGSITGVLGRDLHGLLHDDCSAESCSLQAALRSADSGARSGEVREFEIRDALLGRALHVTLRPMSVTAGEATVGNDCYAVAIVAADQARYPHAKTHPAGKRSAIQPAMQKSCNKA